MYVKQYLYAAIQLFRISFLQTHRQKHK